MIKCGRNFCGFVEKIICAQFQQMYFSGLRELNMTKFFVGYRVEMCEASIWEEKAVIFASEVLEKLLVRI